MGSKPWPKMQALALIGVGLMVMGATVWLLLPVSAPVSREGLAPLPVRVNYPAPELNLTDVQGNPVSLADYLGQVVLVNNWATWCPPCKEEMPALQAYYEAHRESEFSVIAIEAGDPVDEVSAFVESYGLTFPVWTDPTLRATAAFRNPGMPSSYVIDAQGAVRLAWTGAIRLDSLEEYVTPFLEE